MPVTCWLDRLSWGPDQVGNERAIDYWAAQGNTPLFLNIVRTAHKAQKETWDAIVEIFTRFEPTDDVISSLICSTADINWPGAGRAYTYVVDELGRTALPVIDEMIKLNQDPPAEDLQEMKDHILERHPD